MKSSRGKKRTPTPKHSSNWNDPAVQSPSPFSQEEIQKAYQTPTRIYGSTGIIHSSKKTKEVSPHTEETTKLIDDTSPGSNKYQHGTVSSSHGYAPNDSCSPYFTPKATQNQGYSPVHSGGGDYPSSSYFSPRTPSSYKTSTKTNEGTKPPPTPSSNRSSKKNAKPLVYDAPNSGGMDVRDETTKLVYDASPFSMVQNNKTSHQNWYGATTSAVDEYDPLPPTPTSAGSRGGYHRHRRRKSNQEKKSSSSNLLMPAVAASQGQNNDNNNSRYITRKNRLGMNNGLPPVSPGPLKNQMRSPTNNENTRRVKDKFNTIPSPGRHRRRVSAGDARSICSPGNDSFLANSSILSSRSIRSSGIGSKGSSQKMNKNKQSHRRSNSDGKLRRLKHKRSNSEGAVPAFMNLIADSAFNYEKDVSFNGKVVISNMPSGSESGRKKGHRRRESGSSTLSVLSIAGSLVSEASLSSYVTDIKKSTFFRGMSTETGDVDLQLPMDAIRIATDHPDLEAGVICKESEFNEDEIFNQYYHNADLNNKKNLIINNHHRSLPEPRYIINVSGDLYKRVLSEIDDSRNMPCGLYYCGHHEDVDRPNVLLALFPVLTLFIVMYIFSISAY